MAAEEEAIDTSAKDEEPGTDVTRVTHDPFSFKVLSLAQAQQSLNGLRHNDHLRYRQYCTRRLGRLYKVLHFKHGRGRFKAVPFPEDFSDIRFLEIPLVAAERSWSYGVQLKADNAAASQMNPRWRRHSINRFAKAVKSARQLEALCKIHGDQRTQLEAEAYASFLEGTWLVEKESWEEALAKVKLCRRLCERLGLASEAAEAAMFKAKAEELAPMLRECKYNLGMDYDADDPDEDLAKTSRTTRQDLSELSYRGRGLAIPSEKIKGKLLKCLQMASSLKVDSSEGSAVVIEKYGELSAEFGDVLRDIHTDMINAGSDEDLAAEWRLLEAFARELSISMNVERNIMLLESHIRKLDPLEDICSLEARKACRPEEGVRYCDLLAEDLTSLSGLPDTGDAAIATSVSSSLGAYRATVANCRCLFLSLCYMSVGKALEAASLMDMLHARVPDSSLDESPAEPLGRLHPLFERVHRGLPVQVARWRCRGLARLCSAEAGDSKAKGEISKQLEDFAELAAFPPGFRDIPCKPLLFDLAFPSIVAPDMSSLITRKGAGEGQQKGLLGHISGISGKLGGGLSKLWGGRK